MLSGREMLIYFSVKYEGDWQKIYQAIIGKQTVEPEELKRVISPVVSNVVTMVDPEYPKELLHATNCPFVLYYYGDLSLISDPDSCIAVIGSRENSAYGKNVTEEIVSGIADHLVIISGMAKGIDSIAMRTALANGGHVVAVLGSGIDYCYPARNQDLYDELKRHHLIISEYPLRVEPKPQNFIDRNRIIACLPHAILVTEAKYRSGTLSTVTDGLQFGKDVLCVPHHANTESLCNRLLKEGAGLVENSEDVLDDFKFIFK